LANSSQEKVTKLGQKLSELVRFQTYTCIGGDKFNFGVVEEGLCPRVVVINDDGHWENQAQLIGWSPTEMGPFQQDERPDGVVVILVVFHWDNESNNPVISKVRVQKIEQGTE
jgi:hypothetical protein